MCVVGKLLEVTWESSFPFIPIQCSKIRWELFEYYSTKEAQNVGERKGRYKCKLVTLNCQILFCPKNKNNFCWCLLLQVII